jgi:hypothetical protein
LVLTVAEEETKRVQETRGVGEEETVAEDSSARTRAE